MYLLTLHVPAYLDGERTLVTTEWKRSLLLLRQNLQGRLGPVALLCPFLPAGASTSQNLEPVSESHDGVRIIASFDRRCSTAAYWTRDRARWRADLRREVARARVVHSGMCDVYRPINFAGHLEGLRQRRATVFVSDTDVLRQLAELRSGAPLLRRLEARLYAAVFERCMRHGVRTADLSLLKGRALMQRYAPFARCARSFQDASHLECEIVERETVERRGEELRARRRPLRLAYCGRFEPRKGVDDSVRTVARARALGADLELHLFGSGSQEQALRDLARESGAADRVLFHGRRDYGPGLLRELAACDALLFTPRAEDTPRMIFDAFAAGLPLLGRAIPYVCERLEEDRAGMALPDGVEPAARLLAELDARRERLAPLSLAALDAARAHAADRWYRLRAEWTVEAVERHERLAAAGAAEVRAGA